MGFFVVASMGSNRTFMELKFNCCSGANWICFSSNRTFMELKSVIGAYSEGLDRVLIVPLWN